MNVRKQAELLLKKVRDQDLHVVIALMRELTEHEDYVVSALDEADYLAAHTTERMTHDEVFTELRSTKNS